MAKPNPMGGTFAERTAAAEGKSSFDAPEVVLPGEFENSTFAERAKAAAKNVDAESVEDKAVAKKTTSRKKG
jgi:hypothetical protein